MPSSPVIYRIALPIPLPQLFDYLPPENQPVDSSDIGRRIQVPFGNRQLIGIIVEIGTPQTQHPLRHALSLFESQPLLEGELLKSLNFLARYTHAPIGETLATALPTLLRQNNSLPETNDWAWQLTALGQTQLANLRAGKPKELAQHLHAIGQQSEQQLGDSFPGWRTPARSLLKRQLVERVAIAAHYPTAPQISGPALHAEQQTAVDAIAASQGFTPFLLEGVTGSGKTEVYLQAISQCLARGQQALVLVPEISLTPQTLSRFRQRLGVPIHALHSGLNNTERARSWLAFAQNNASVAVGTRSAIFTPLPNPGLMIVDEEHDQSYKQQDGIRYHARDFALIRAKALNIPIILGSATPSLESLHNAQRGRYQHLKLTQRAGQARPPSVRVLDIRKRPLQAGLSPEVVTGITQALTAGGQVLVFKNRRGYAPVLLCHDCGWIANCRRCDSAMTFHAGQRRLQCHHCGASQTVPQACPECSGLALQPQGVGTERLEEFLATAFPDVPVLRIDRDTTQRRDALEQQLSRLGEDPGILVGTQILAKGHDLPHLTLVVVVGIDEGLFSSDFRASERLAQQLIQVAGRAGRAQKPGQVWLQTHHPDHPLLHTLLTGGYRAFAQAELEQREGADFPPFTHLALLRAEARDQTTTMSFLQTLKQLIPPQGRNPQIHIHGPLNAPMPRRAGMQRAQLLLASEHRQALHQLLDQLLPQIYSLPQARKVRWSLDVDPIDLY